MAACCMTVRNCESYLPKVLVNVERLRILFPTFSLVVAYDHCTDRSEAILQKYKKDADYPVYLLPTEISDPLRTVRISNARNRCLDQLTQLKVQFHFMVDADDVNQSPWNLTLIQYYLTQHDWDSLSFARSSYYDIWALMYPPFRHHCWGFGSHSIEVVSIMKEDIERNLKHRHSLFPCDSAFNGFAIYRTPAFEGIRYSGYESDLLPLISEKDRRHTEKVLGFPVVPHSESCEHLYYHLKSRARIRISPYSISGTSSSSSLGSED
jgi:glycosyltransferase involved in cell wall biosynthesis